MQKERSLPLEYSDGLPSREAIESMEGTAAGRPTDIETHT